jgi:hypothetical protein
MPGEQVPPPWQVASEVHDVVTQPGKSRFSASQMSLRPSHLAGASVALSPQQSSVTSHSTRVHCLAVTLMLNSFLAQMPLRQARPLSQSLRARHVSPRLPRVSGTIFCASLLHPCRPSADTANTETTAIKERSPIAKLLSDAKYLDARSRVPDANYPDSPRQREKLGGVRLRRLVGPLAAILTSTEWLGFRPRAHRATLWALGRVDQLGAQAPRPPVRR